MKKFVLIFLVFVFTLFNKMSAQQKDTIPEEDLLNLSLEELMQFNVYSTRAFERKTPVVFTNIDNEYINEMHTVEDIPMLLTEIPNTFAYSDAGSMMGYSHLKVRGFSMQRQGVMINGIPQNDPEDQLVIWVDMPDLASSIENIQFQRGVGSSLYGASTFSGSLNVLTSTEKDEKYEVSIFGGSYNTQKMGVKLSKPLLDDKLILQVRLSELSSDGYRERSDSKQWAYFFSLNWIGEKSLIKFNAFGGNEVCHASWNPSPESELKENRKHNPIDYKNTVDNFTQSHFDLHHTYFFNESLTWKNTLFYIYGSGYYESYKKDRNLWEYGLVNNEDTELESDLIREKWVKKGNLGLISQLSWKHEKSEFTIGTFSSMFQSNHYGNVMELKDKTILPDFEEGFTYYRYRGKKNYITFFANELYDIGENLNLMINLHFQRIDYSFEQDEIANFKGKYRNSFDLEYNFFNPRIGLNYNINANFNIFGNVSVAQKEPVDSEMFDTFDGADDLGVNPLFEKSDTIYKESGEVDKVEWSSPMVKSEKLIDYEIGCAYINNNLKINFNLFRMDFSNQVISNAQLRDDFPVSGNGGKTIHQGIEFMLKYKLPHNFEISTNFAYNNNHFDELTQYEVNWDTYEVSAIDFKDKKVTGFPDFLANFRLTYRTHPITTSLHFQHIGKQYLDNSNLEKHSIPSFTVVNAFVILRYFQIFENDLEVKLLLNNILNKEYYTAGYSYGGENYLWTGAKFNFIVGLNYVF